MNFIDKLAMWWLCKTFDYVSLRQSKDGEDVDAITFAREERFLPIDDDVAMKRNRQKDN